MSVESVILLVGIIVSVMGGALIVARSAGATQAKMEANSARIERLEDKFTDHTARDDEQLRQIAASLAAVAENLKHLNEAFNELRHSH